jgi:hypothetical protein
MTLERKDESEGREPRDEGEGSAEEPEEAAESGYTEEEEAEVAKRLEDLGYL